MLAGTAAKEMLHFMRSGIRVSLCKGDLTEETTDAIVNAANEQLRHGGGLAGMIARKGGSSIQQESNLIVQKLGGTVPTGTCVVTKPGLLKCKHIIHAVGPIWSGYSNAKARDILRQTIQSVQKQAEDLSLESYSLTAVSSGIFGYPKDLCATDILGSLTTCLKSLPQLTPLKSIMIVIFDQPTFDAFSEEFSR